MKHSAPTWSRLAVLFALVPTVTGVAGPARAQDDTRKAQERACSHDVSRHCRKVMSDGDMAVHQCLLQNHDKLSPSCRRLVDGH
ncbi:hypothetical protein [Bradyrhizobium sp. 2TAF24]|uniref:hypothetical protein n=1 Tax=Bradyrhizobium sp. 2TAF24 TaxID=3233011 RepID=UPI003F9348F7